MQLLVLAKKPVAGRVKTRLCPPLTPDGRRRRRRGRARGHPRRRPRRAGRAAGCWCVDGTLTADGFDLQPQRGGPLDERLGAAFDDAAAASDLPALLVGMDTPQLTAALLGRGRARPARHDAVLGLAPDGGWWALGLRARTATCCAASPPRRDDTGALQRAAPARPPGSPSHAAAGAARRRHRRRRPRRRRPGAGRPLRRRAGRRARRRAAWRAGGEAPRRGSAAARLLVVARGRRRRAARRAARRARRRHGHARPSGRSRPTCRFAPVAPGGTHGRRTAARAAAARHPRRPGAARRRRRPAARRRGARHRRRPRPSSRGLGAEVDRDLRAGLRRPGAAHRRSSRSLGGAALGLPGLPPRGGARWPPPAPGSARCWSSAPSPALTFDERSLAEPRFTGLLASAPDRGRRRARHRRALRRLHAAARPPRRQRQRAVRRSPAGCRCSPPTDDTIRVLHVSDLHLNPAACDVIGSVVDQFAIDVVIDTGDITDFGSAAEDALRRRDRRARRPLRLRPRQPRQPRTQAAVAAPAERRRARRPGGRRGRPALRFLGQGDPRFTPDKTTRDDDAPAERARPASAAPSPGRSARRARPAATSSPSTTRSPPGRCSGARPLVLAGHAHQRAGRRPRTARCSWSRARPAAPACGRSRARSRRRSRCPCSTSTRRPARSRRTTTSPSAGSAPATPASRARVVAEPDVEPEQRRARRPSPAACRPVGRPARASAMLSGPRRPDGGGAPAVTAGVRPHRPAAQDSTLSRWLRGFESRWGHSTHQHAATAWSTIQAP